MSKLPEIEKKLSKIISLGQNKTPEMKTLKESNINAFKEILEIQIKYINKIKQDELGEDLENVIQLLDDFFQRDFNKRKEDLIEIENLREKQILIEKELDSFYVKSMQIIEKAKKEFKSKIKKSLIDNKKELKNKLESKDYETILKEINIQIKNNLKGLNDNIIEFIKYNAEMTNKILTIRKKIIEQFLLKERKDDKSFYIDISKKLGNGEKDLEAQLSGELKSSCNCLNILWKKGIKDFFNSLFSDLNYLENIIDILIDTSLKKINFILDLIGKESNNLVKSYYKGIILFMNMASVDLTDEQKKIWNDLCSLYKKRRIDIINSKTNIIEILNKNNK